MNKPHAVTLKVKNADSIKDKLIGLTRSQNPIPLFISTRFGVHTFGLRFPLDVVVLDDDLLVVKLKETLSSGKLFFWNPKFSKILELPSGTIKKNNIKLGTRLRISTY